MTSPKTSLDLTRVRVPLFNHQLADVETCLEQPYFAVMNEMGLGKTATMIHVACLLYEQRKIDLVVVTAPAQCKSAWLDKELGELQKHTWVVSNVLHYNGSQKTLKFDPEYLNWVVCSYEFLRQGAALQALEKAIQGRRTMLVMDESIFLKNHKAIQTRHLWELSHLCCRRYLLNGTPHGGRLEETFTQFKILNPAILGCENYFHFRARYCVLGGFNKKQIISYKNQEDYVRRTKPFVVRRLKEDCLDLPPKTYSHLTVPLTEENWKRYKAMRDDMIAWLGSDACVVQHAPVKAMRLSQLTCGLLGGVQAVDPEEWRLYGVDELNQPVVAAGAEKKTEVVGSEKLDFILGWLAEKFREDENFRVLIWCRFRLELERLFTEVKKITKKVFTLQGGQDKRSREEAVHEGMAGAGSCVILGNPHAGGFGLNLTTIQNVMYASCDYSLLSRQQSEDRCHRIGVVKNVFYVDLLATGPEGQQTLDHLVVKALRKKSDLLKWTSDQWQNGLLEEWQ